MNDNALYLHLLNRVPLLDIPAIHRLLTVCGSPEKAWEASVETLKKARIQHALAIHHQKESIDMDREWALLHYSMEKYQMHLITVYDDHYPKQLQELSHPPQLLYCRGDIALLHEPFMISIVGSRKATAYGKRVVDRIVAELTAVDVVIVSGLAIGIDGKSHRATLTHSGKTIGVLGSSLLPDEIMPSSNQRLAQHMIDSGGLIISEYPPGTPGYPSNFPERNRIIAGLSQATIIIEAAKKSGSLITARLASECSRDVFAVPGPITAPQSSGTNELIARGAIPFLSCDQLYETLEWKAPQSVQAHKITQTLTTEEKTIVDICSDEPASLDQLIESSGLPSHSVIGIVTQLTLRGILQENESQQYQTL